MAYGFFTNSLVVAAAVAALLLVVVVLGFGIVLKVRPTPSNTFRTVARMDAKISS
jgi:hypothetical protein